MLFLVLTMVLLKTLESHENFYRCGALPAVEVIFGMTKDKLFFGALLGVTALPMIGIPLASDLPLSGKAVAFILWFTFVIVGPCHVASTGFFYADRDFRPVMESESWRFGGLALAVPIVAMLVGISGPGPLLALLVLSGAWVVWHYQRQNYGLLALAAANVKAGQVPRSISLAFNMAAVAGFLAVAGYSSRYPYVAVALPKGAADLGRYLALAVYAASLFPLFKGLRECPALGRSWRPVGLLVSGWAFFFPAFLTRDPLVAVGAYGLSHALQYLMMMSRLSIASRPKAVGFLVMLGIVAAGWPILNFLNMPALFGLSLGISFVHFTLDAKLWRLREPVQRAIIRRRFAFLFG